MALHRELQRLGLKALTFHFHALEKEMATHASVLAWRIPGMAEPGRLLSMESQSRTRLKRLSSSSSSSSKGGNEVLDKVPELWSQTWVEI